MSDRFADAGVPARRGTGQPARSPPPRAPAPLTELPALDRARHLAAALNEPEHEKYFQRQEFYEDNFDQLLETTGLTVTWPPLPDSVSDLEPGLCCRLVANERLPDGPPVAWLLLCWDESPFATLLLADAGPP
ncbi:MAG: hypothetical protein LC808_24980 [Actinobacteria bacterium]|nr:hypothetical protein [Actinomycetota bacterium]